MPDLDGAVQKIVGDVLEIPREPHHLLIHAVARHACELPNPFCPLSVIRGILHGKVDNRRDPPGVPFLPAASPPALRPRGSARIGAAAQNPLGSIGNVAPRVRGCVVTHFVG
jgi:hypothetical protein